MHLFRQFSFLFYGAGSFRIDCFWKSQCGNCTQKTCFEVMAFSFFYHTEMLKYQFPTQGFTSIC